MQSMSFAFNPMKRKTLRRAICILFTYAERGQRRGQTLLFELNALRCFVKTLVFELNPHKGFTKTIAIGLNASEGFVKTLVFEPNPSKGFFCCNVIELNVHEL